MDNLIPILILSLIGSVLALIGGIIFLFNCQWAQKLICYSTPFAAGVLLTVSLLGVLPEAVELLNQTAFLIVLFSFLAAYLFEHFLFGLHHHDNQLHCNHLNQGSIPLVIIGDTIHNFVDGIVIASSYLVNPGLGIITTISTFLHEIPHEIADFAILNAAGWKKRSIITVNLVSALATIVAALFVLFIPIDEKLNGIFLAIAGGLFLYLSASDFLPHIDEIEINRHKMLAALLIGVIIMLITFKLIPHSQEVHQDQDKFIPIASEVSGK